ncbi:MAG: hypothetical protein WC992_03955 [Acholeplasmataceae bacterium]|jgi:hypothetical protein
MIIQYIQKKRTKNLALHLIFLVFLIVIYILGLFLIDPSNTLVHILGASLLFMTILSFIIGLRRIKKSLRNKKIKMIQTRQMIPYPQKFTDSMVEVGGFLKGYRYKQHLIPDYLIEFREGRTLYLYQMIQEITDELYTIVRVHKFDIALVLDGNRKKRIIHLGNAELVE